MQLILIALLTATAYAAYNVFVKVAAADVEEVLGAVILQAVALLLGGALLVWLLITRDAPLAVTQRGVLFSVLAGLAVGAAEILSFYVFARGLSITVGLPLIIGGSVGIGAVLGVVFLGETLTATRAAGLALMVVAIGLLTAR